MPAIEVRLYVNGNLQISTQSTAGGSFSVEVALYDGDNDVYATVWDGADESLPSDIVSIGYQNNIDRNQTSTSITTNTVWTPGSTASPYIVTNSLTVEPGAELILHPGTEIRFDNGSGLIINGGLSIRGTDTDVVTLTGSSGNWQGITISGSASPVIIEYALIHKAYDALVVNGVEFTLSNSEISEFRYTGIQALSVTNGVVQNNYIHHGGFPISWMQGIGVHLYRSYIHMMGNRIEQAQTGILIEEGSDPLINMGNVITDNKYGIDIYGDDVILANNPAPIITGNEIKFNLNKNISVDSYANARQTELDVSGNWWGSANPNDIMKGVTYFDGYATPVVKMAPYLDAPGGVLTGSDYLSGFITPNFTVDPGQSYTVMGTLVVPAGVTMTLQAGAELRFIDRSDLIVFGTIKSLGFSSAPVRLVSDNPQAIRGSWNGLRVGFEYVGNISSSVIQNTIIEYASYGIDVYEDGVTIIGNSISEFKNAGIDINENANGIVTGNLVENGDGTGINVYDASPDVKNNSIRNVSKGIRLHGSSSLIEGNNIQGSTRAIEVYSDFYRRSSPVIQGENTITNNDYGIYVDSNSNNDGLYRPVVTGNSIYSNNIYLLCDGV